MIKRIKKLIKGIFGDGFADYLRLELETFAKDTGGESKSKLKVD